jgi:hypothetical protein
MAMFNFNKKKEEKKNYEDLTEAPLPEENNKSDNLTELPEFPTMPDEGISALPRIDPLNDLEKNDITIPSMSERPIAKPAVKKHEESFDEYPQRENIHDEMNHFSELISSFDEKKQVKEEDKKQYKERPKIVLKDHFDEESKEGPVFVNVKKYSGIVNYIEVSGIERNFDLSVSELEKIKQKDYSELESLKKSLEGLQGKIMIVDDIISKG